VLQVWICITLLFAGAYAQQSAVQVPSLAQCEEWFKSDSIDYHLLAVDQAMNHQGDQRQEVLSLLHHALRDKQSVVRIVAERNIQRLHDKSSIVPLIEALGDDDASIDDNYGGIFAGSIPPYIRMFWRAEVISVLREYGTEAAAALPLVRRYIKGDFAYSGPRCEAISFVGVLRDRTSISLLIPLVTGETKTMNDYIECAVEALGQIGDPKAVPALEKYALNSDVPKIREAAVIALANIRSTNSDLQK